MGKGAMLGSLEDTLTMSREIEGVEPCLDFAHLHARPGDGSINTFGEWSEILTKYKKALGQSSLKQLHCHLSGIEYGEKGERNHLMLNESDFDLMGLLKALQEFNCGGRILCESPENMDKDALVIKQTWESISN
jgi:deoxyribonuclease-4